MSSPRLHDRLIAEAARPVLRPLGFQRKGRSRLWFADQHWWLAVVEFQPGGWSRGAYLNVAAKWLWRGDAIWSFDFGFHGGARVAGYVEFENELQFREQVHRLAESAALEAQRLRDAFRTIRAAADHLRERASAGADGWDLYHAGVAAFLAGRSDEAQSYFRHLSVPRDTDHAGAVWLQELRRTAQDFVEMCNDRQRFSELLTEQLHRSRAAFGLQPCRQALPGASLYAV